MRSVTPWILAALLLFAPGLAAPVRAQGWDDDEAAREKKKQAEQQAREREMREREEMERRKHDGRDGRDGMEGGPDGPPRPGPMPPNGRRPPKPLDEEEQKVVLAWLKDWDPDRLAKIDRLRAENPEFYVNLLTDSYMEMQKIQDMKSREPEHYDSMMKERKLDLQCRQISEKYRKTEDETQKASIKTELQTVLNQLFDIREAGREMEVKELEKRLSELRQIVEKRRTNKLLIVENRLKQLLGEKEYMDW